MTGAREWVKRAAGDRLEMRESRLTGRLLGLFAAGWLLLNFPLFSIWDRSELVFGWPLLPTAAFAIWLALIVALALLMERGAADEPAEDGAAQQNSLPPDP